MCAHRRYKKKAQDRISGNERRWDVQKYLDVYVHEFNKSNEIY